jgi:hypothetical protein
VYSEHVDRAPSDRYAPSRRTLVSRRRPDGRGRPSPHAPVARSDDAGLRTCQVPPRSHATHRDRTGERDPRREPPPRRRRRHPQLGRRRLRRRRPVLLPDRPTGVPASASRAVITFPTVACVGYADDDIAHVTPTSTTTTSSPSTNAASTSPPRPRTPRPRLSPLRNDPPATAFFQGQASMRSANQSAYPRRASIANTTDASAIPIAFAAASPNDA